LHSIFNHVFIVTVDAAQMKPKTPLLFESKH